MRYWGAQEGCGGGVAHTILVMSIHILTHGVPYHELRAAYLDQHDRDQATRWHVKRLERLRHRVPLELVA